MSHQTQANFDEWNADYAYNHSTFGRDLFKLIGMLVQGMIVPGLHPSVSVVRRRLYGGAVYHVLTNPEEVARFLGVVVPPRKRRTVLSYFYDLMKSWGCIFHCLSEGFFRVANDLIADENTEWRFRVRTGVLDDANRLVLTEINFRTLLEDTIDRFRCPRGRLQDTIRHDLSPFIEFLINGVSYPSSTQARDQLTGIKDARNVFLRDLKQELVDSFYSNPQSFVTTEPSYNPSNLSVSGTYPATTKRGETDVVVKFNRGFTEDDFSR